MTSTPSPHPDPEALAAFVDGRLEGEERRRLTEHLADCEPCYEIFSGVVAFQAEAEEAGGAVVAPVVAIRRHPLRRAVPLAAAAAVAGVVLLPLLRGPAEPPTLTSARLLAPLEEESGELVGLVDTGVYRGNGRAVDTDIDRRDFHLGVQLVDLEVSLLAEDKEKAANLLFDLRNILLEAGLLDEQAEGYAELRRQLAEEAPPWPEIRATTTRLEGELVDRFSPLYLNFGKWAEAGWLAARGGDGEYFASPAHRRFLRWLERRGAETLSPEVVEELDALTALLEKGPPPEDQLPALAKRYEAIKRLLKPRP